MLRKLGINQLHEQMNILLQKDTMGGLWFSVVKMIFRAEREKLFSPWFPFKYLAGIAFYLMAYTTDVLAQDCPSFQVVEIKSVQSGIANGSAVFQIRGLKRYTESNFEVRQKQKNVTGPLDFDIEVTITGDELKVSGLKRCEDLYLEEYVIFFSDRSCNNGEVVEVGTFKIN